MISWLGCSHGQLLVGDGCRTLGGHCFWCRQNPSDITQSVQRLLAFKNLKDYWKYDCLFIAKMPVLLAIAEFLLQNDRNHPKASKNIQKHHKTSKIIQNHPKSISHCYEVCHFVYSMSFACCCFESKAIWKAPQPLAPAPLPQRPVRPLPARPATPPVPAVEAVAEEDSRWVTWLLDGLNVCVIFMWYHAIIFQKHMCSISVQMFRFDSICQKWFKMIQVWRVESGFDTWIQGLQSSPSCFGPILSKKNLKNESSHRTGLWEASMLHRSRLKLPPSRLSQCHQSDRCSQSRQCSRCSRSRRRTVGLATQRCDDWALGVGQRDLYRLT